jgi:hypothetical protein
MTKWFAAAVCAVSTLTAAPDPALTVLTRRCVACHGADEHARQANLRLDTFAGATANGAIVPGDSAHSRVIARVTHPKTPMPPTGPRLTPEEVASLKTWIDAGAKYTRHWSFEKPTRPEPPAVKNEAWIKNPVDRFVLARLEKENLAPSPEADRYLLARRVALDLTGLPPDPEQAKLPYEQLVDELLKSPRYGERWAKVWLDLARYADTQGYEKDSKRVIWPYRDWVIRAFNDNLPFDRFTILQLAGDLTPDPSVDDLIATGFHRNTMTNTEGGTDDEEFRDAAIRDRIAVTGQVWMGLTVGCAQCHTHKYDPITHKEFYQLYAFLNQTADNDQPGDQPLLKLTSDTSTLIMRELPMEKRRHTRIYERGNYLTPGAEVEPATPEAFPPMPASWPTNRLGLAQWLVSNDNPLTARVQVNRFWARLFGKGIVETEEDFGTQGAQPTHPELLDWLATGFVANKWDVKALLKTIVMSNTYRQSSNATPEVLQRDPQNRLYSRGPRYRLEAEAVRDQALAVSGLLSKKMYGPPAMPWQPEGVWLVVYNGDKWDTSKGEDRYRRALYTFMRRTSPYPSMMNYDAPTGEVCTVRRIRTNTPLQALTTLNDPVSMEAAAHLAARARSAAELFQLALVRPPSKAEVERLNMLHKQAKAELKNDPASANKLLRFTENLYGDGRDITLVADSRTTPATWRYHAADPGANWAAPDYDDNGWTAAQGAFGSGRRPPDDLKLPVKWDTEQLWLRTEVTLAAPLPERYRLSVRANVQVELYVNGVQGVAAPWERSGYYDYAIAPAASAAFKPGRNVIAVKITRNHAEAASQFFDGGVYATRPLENAKVDLDRAAWVVVANTVLNLDEMVTKR